ncbi:hypothetical protein ILUMI_10003, partial [Ignelater luminosus]
DVGLDAVLLQGEGDDERIIGMLVDFLRSPKEIIQLPRKNVTLVDSELRSPDLTLN